MFGLFYARNFATMIRFFTLFLLFSVLMVEAQITEVPKEVKRIQVKFPDSTQGWKKKNNIKLLINQSLYENWQSGGVSNIELKTHFKHNFNYQKEDLIWDNTLMVDYGLSKVNGYEIRKTQDKMEFNSIVGGKLPGMWSYSYFINIQTPLTNTYNYDKDLNKENRTAGVFAPLYIATGPGFMWKKNNDMYINIAPVTAKSIYINGHVHKYDKELDRFVSNDEKEIYGVLPGESFKHKLGFYSSALLKLNLANNIKMENRVSLYSNYMNSPENVDLDYSMHVTMKVNKLLTTQFMFRTRYDNEEYKGLQIQESFGVGFNFNI